MMVLLLLQLLGLANPEAKALPSVVVGELVYLQAKGPADMAHERAFYVHENYQYAVLRADRVLAGGRVDGLILVGLKMSGNQAFGRITIAPNYVVLDSVAWRVGSRVIVRATPSEETGWECSPAVATEIGGSRSSAPYLDEALNAYRQLPVYCANDDDFFLVDQ